MNISIDPNSGFCPGVVSAIRKAEEVLDAEGQLYCLGEIVHNSDEVQRLRSKGLITITHEELKHLHGVKVLLRAHGEPPSTYETARANGIEIIDATCPVVLSLQRRILAERQRDPNTQIIIYGQPGHAEVNGLVGQTDGFAVVIEGSDDLHNIDPARPSAVYSQTTKSIVGYNQVTQALKELIHPDVELRTYDTICRQVSGRINSLRNFARSHDVILFVAGRQSSNGKVLFNECRSVNPRTYLVANADEINPQWLQNASSVGVCGATSTPKWLMEQVAHLHLPK